MFSALYSTLNQLNWSIKTLLSLSETWNTSVFLTFHFLDTWCWNAQEEKETESLYSNNKELVSLKCVKRGSRLRRQTRGKCETSSVTTSQRLHNAERTECELRWRQARGVSLTYCDIFLHFLVQTLYSIQDCCILAADWLSRAVRHLEEVVLALTGTGRPPKQTRPWRQQSGGVP